MHPSAAVQREAQRQQLLLRVLHGQTPAAELAPHMRAGSGFARGLQAHQAHAHALAERALAAAYPTVRQLLGDAAFAALARAHWHHAPPAHADINQWGDGLADFMAALPDLAGEPYISDLARLEWAVHQAASAADATAAPLGLHQLAETDALLLHRVRLLARAGTVLIESSHAIVSVWQAHQAGALHSADRFATARTALAEQRAQPALVWRQGWQVQVAALAADEAAFTRAVLNGDTLGDALQATLERSPGLPIQTWFETWLLLQLKRGWLAGACLP